MEIITIALGGNALGSSSKEQQENIEKTLPAVADLVEAGYKVVLTHGNGPQVGMIYKAFDFAAAHTDRVCRFDLQESTAMSQGYIGYHLQKGMLKEFRHRGIEQHVVSLVTQVEVSPDDPCFQNPEKPIGDFYSKEEAEAIMQEDVSQIFKEDAGRGWRRVVPSPKPLHILEAESISHLLSNNHIVIACGGGGIPLIKDESDEYRGVPAVIDKDHSAALLAHQLGAHYLIILTAVDNAFLHYGTARQKELSKISSSQARHYIGEGHFAAGSMLPKIEAALRFVEGDAQRKAFICSLEKLHATLAAKAGTQIYKS